MRRGVPWDCGPLSRSTPPSHLTAHATPHHKPPQHHYPPQPTITPHHPTKPYTHPTNQPPPTHVPPMHTHTHTCRLHTHTHTHTHTRGPCRPADDPVSAVALHLFCGVWGLLFPGLLAQPTYVADVYGAYGFGPDVKGSKK